MNKKYGDLIVKILSGEKKTVYFKNPEKVSPFEINKSGFGSAAAWLCYIKIPVV